MSQCKDRVIFCLIFGLINGLIKSVGYCLLKIWSPKVSDSVEVWFLDLVTHWWVTNIPPFKHPITDKTDTWRYMISVSSSKKEWPLCSNSLFKSPKNKGSGMSLSVPSKCWSVRVDVTVNRQTYCQTLCALCVLRLSASMQWIFNVKHFSSFSLSSQLLVGHT